MHIIILWIWPHKSCSLLYKYKNDEFIFARRCFPDVATHQIEFQATNPKPTSHIRNWLP